MCCQVCAPLANLTLVRSSALRSVGYDQEQRVLEIEFTNGAVYRYFDVPAVSTAG